jgi:hypothetical protein
MPKSNKFTVQIDSTGGLSAKDIKSIERAINGAVDGSLAKLDLKGSGKALKKFSPRNPPGKYIRIIDLNK